MTAKAKPVTGKMRRERRVGWNEKNASERVTIPCVMGSILLGPAPSREAASDFQRCLFMQGGALKRTADRVRGVDWERLYAANSGGLSGFGEVNLASTSPQSAHRKYWIPNSRRAGWRSIARTFTGLPHFGQRVSMNNVKDMMSPFRARRTKDTQKGPRSTE
jgi:hypothetical protein